jgi:hypothetical protein
MVEHCGGVKEGGNFVHTLTLTDMVPRVTSDSASVPVHYRSTRYRSADAE